MSTETIEELAKKIEELADDMLTKSCPRCGGESANKGNKAGRCRSCLNKLARNKKKVGHYLHHGKIADDAIRRQKGENGTSHKKTKGLGTRKEIIDKVKSEEKKYGTVVSLNRKDNSKGYSKENIVGVKPSLNRGRHEIDQKKVSEWKKRMAKCEITSEELATLVAAKLIEDEESDNLQGT
jgi:hypothetical protein